MVVNPIGQTQTATPSVISRLHFAGDEQAFSDGARETARNAAQDKRNEAKRESVDAAAKTNSDMRGIDLGSTYISFEINKELGRVITRVMDKSTGEVIREIPPKELQDIAVQLRKAAGRLLDETV